MIALTTNRPPSGNFTINRGSWQARGLTAWWPLAGNIHEYVRDYPGGILFGNAALGTTGQGRALKLPGADPDYLNTYSTLGQGLSYLTISAWAYTDTLAGGAFNLRYVMGNEGPNQGWQMRLSTADNKLYWFVYSGAYRSATSSFTLAVNTWYHFVGVYNIAEAAPSQVKLYIDGRYNAQGASAGGAIAASANTIGIGAEPGFTDRVWSGAIRDVRIYERALGGQEIYRLWAPQSRYDLYKLPELFTRYAAVGGTTTIRLNWTDYSEHEDGFSIERKTDAGAFGEIDTVAADIETYDNVLVPTGHTYTYRVKAESAALGDSEYSNEAAETV